jgi:hypothetical protein
MPRCMCRAVLCCACPAGGSPGAVTSAVGGGHWAAHVHPTRHPAVKGPWVPEPALAFGEPNMSFMPVPAHTGEGAGHAAAGLCVRRCQLVAAAGFGDASIHCMLAQSGCGSHNHLVSDSFLLRALELTVRQAVADCHAGRDKQARVLPAGSCKPISSCRSRFTNTRPNTAHACPSLTDPQPVLACSAAAAAVALAFPALFPPFSCLLQALPPTGCATRSAPRPTPPLST